jgi:hypothetical protein
VAVGRFWFVVGALITATLAVSAAPALANSTTSQNWAGYAVHRKGVSFNSVTGTWRQPKAHCTPGMQTWSAFWVGLGGYSLNATALEQAGTEVDCSVTGKTISSVWYELVPGPPVSIGLDVRPGDRVRATVAVSGRLVTIGLEDLTRHRAFHKTTPAPRIDVSSAEWIVEAPSGCGERSCRTLPLAKFAPTRFRGASVRSTTGHTGTISDRAWGWTRITLKPRGRPLPVHSPNRASGAVAQPSSLLSEGSAFTVRYAMAPVFGAVNRGRAAALGPSGPFR